MLMLNGGKIGYFHIWKNQGQLEKNKNQSWIVKMCIDRGPN
jgi:hypothetical protein